MQPDPLDETRWALEYVNLHGISHLINGRRIPEIAFAQGRVTADDGVNVAEGTYKVSSDRLSMSVEATTSLGYPEVALPEHDLFEHLSAADGFLLHGDFLHVRFGAEAVDELIDHNDTVERVAAAPEAGKHEPGGAGELVYRWEEDEAPA
ncbi:MAG: META domain-containing protein [Microthrixaceae bacterium]